MPNAFNSFSIISDNCFWFSLVEETVFIKIATIRIPIIAKPYTTAEIAKYMENSWLATKVSFCSQFFQIAKRHGVSYEELRELFILDPRVNPSHTFIYEEHPYWESHCLDKDVAHIANSEDSASLLRDIIKFNNDMKDSYKDPSR